MNRKNSLIFSIILLAAIPGVAHAQAWSGILAPSRAIDWTQAGIPGGIPNRTTVCATLNPGATSAQINSAIASCPAGQVVSLGAGTFSYSGGINFNVDNVTLRGQGANSTFLVPTSSGSCNGLVTDVSLCGSNSSVNSEQNVCDWTGGYAQGSTVITLANCGTTTPARGSLANLKVGSILILDQVDEAADTGTIWNCTVVNTCSNTTGNGGFARTDGPSVNGVANRSQEQGVVVTAINGSNITISPGLYMPNWRSGQLPQAWFASTYRTGIGVENLSIDNTSANGNSVFVIMNCVNCWVAGVRSIMGGRNHVEFMEVVHSVVRDSYFYQNKNHLSVSYAIELNNTFDSLVENNICQQVTDSCPNNDGPSAGNVAGYNFGIDEAYSVNGWFQASFYQHASGDEFFLWEGNIGTGYTADNLHGTHHFHTLFRNYLPGWQNQCGGGTCTAQTIAIHMYSGNRYHNVIGNVLGQPGYQNNYTCLGTASNCANGNTSIYALGATGNAGGTAPSVAGYCLQPACTTHGDFDPQTYNYLLRWGNYDTVTAAVRWCGNSSDTGWSTTCASTSEVPTGLASFANPVPTRGDTGAGQSAMPASFYLTSKPSWFGSVTYPAIGPDVTSGNIPGLGGHANMIPAQACYAKIMGGPATGTGNVLTFDANSCYGVSGPPPVPPTSLTAIVH